MGFYLNVKSDGTPLPGRGKAKALIDDGGTVVDGKEFVPNLICVVDNPLMGFDAAGFVYDRQEFLAFSSPDDQRPKKWLTHPKAAAIAIGRAIEKGYAKQLPDGQWELT